MEEAGKRPTTDSYARSAPGDVGEIKSGRFVSAMAYVVRSSA